MSQTRQLAAELAPLVAKELIEELKNHTDFLPTLVFSRRNQSDSPFLRPSPSEEELEAAAALKARETIRWIRETKEGKSKP